ncbi:DNA internalization-related competence protein ComEC/Rec2 [Litoreibacter arenae DSM 19593]|uniref:DNA internalization-related competence protein ComEC/Rec2 n=1 Tax=Litoreibacter arenae DSM 19593 TaxID=1123360 RepID=S9QGM1_9RHOB|nr:DNA internalization-related competence protein ComEC/Rec2 [Litoreibacter arenae DSM 19593]
MLHAVSGSFGRQQSHLFPWAPVCLGVGIGIYFSLMQEPPLWGLGLCAAVLLLCWLVAVWRGCHRGSWVSLVLWALTLSLTGAVVATYKAHAVAAPVLSYRYYGPIEGRIIAIDKSASEKMRLTLDNVRLSRVPPARTPVKVRVSLHGPDMGTTFTPGDVVITTGHLGPPSGPVEPGGFDFQRHLWFQQLGALGYTRNPMLRYKPAAIENADAALRLYTIRRALSEGIKSRMSMREGPFAAAIITGDRSDLDASALEILRASNLAHLLAISGLHMGLLTGAVFAVIRLCLAAIPAASLRLPIRKVAAVAAFAAALVYLGISGASVATQRAFIMVSVMLLAICLERPALSLRAVAMAALVILVTTPQALVGPGFQMSFAATIALVAVFGAIRDRGTFLRVPKWLSGVVALLVSSFIAGAATAPFGAAHFNQVSQYGLLANLLSVPVMGFVVMPGALLAGLLAPFGLEAAGLAVMELGLAWILGVADFVAGLNGSTRAIMAPSVHVLPLVALGGLFLCLWQGAGRLIGLLPICAALLFWASTERPTVLISETGRLIGVLGEGGRALNKPKGDGFSAQVWLENDGDTGDQAHAATRAGFAANDLRVNLNGVKLVFNAANPEKIDLAQACATNDLVVLPRLTDFLPEGCQGWSGADFLTGGSVAIYETKTGLRYENSRSRQGDRLWVPKPRKRRQ